jgi:hypothetical protein
VNNRRVLFEAVDAANPNPDNGIVLVKPQGTGYVRVDLLLPELQHEIATRILNSFRLTG